MYIYATLYIFVFTALRFHGLKHVLHIFEFIFSKGHHQIALVHTDIAKDGCIAVCKLE